MTCWISASLAPSCITMTIKVSCFLLYAMGVVRFEMLNPDTPGSRAVRDKLRATKILSIQTTDAAHSFPLFAVAVARMHGVAFGGAGFVNDALEQAANGGVCQWTGIIAFGVLDHFVLAVGLVQRNFGRLFELADFQSAMRALVQELDEFLVDFVDAAAPVGDVHGRFPRHRRPERFMGRPRGGGGPRGGEGGAGARGRRGASRRAATAWACDT